MKKNKEISDVITAYFRLVTVPIWFGGIIAYLRLTEGLNGLIYIKGVLLTLVAYGLIVLPLSARIEKLIEEVENEG